MAEKGRNYSPSLPRDYGRRYRSPSPRGCYGDRSRDLPTSLLVRNLRHDCRVEDLRGPLGQFGHLKDIYLPRDNYTGPTKGLCHGIGTMWFWIVQYLDPADAADAKYHTDGYVLCPELTFVLAEGNRKKPSEMREREHRSFFCSPDYYCPSRKRHYSRSISPRDGRCRG
ncbi:hypothetical protein ES288_A09G159700v1 [Gossypium darwinii]|uniref:RRM domain-containing protein n=1 Tax=Gossypium darwinii TaxID=34276 RepID=A0A5D2F9D4_GOSDA|nr:hypothetical protein ES288_A09G159700v1 [Gossypium darwinii]